jgi:YfiH family protein
MTAKKNYPEDWIIPDWPVSKKVRSFITSRNGGFSGASYSSMNLGEHVGDFADSVTKNRELLRTFLPSEPVWLKQVHGVQVIEAHPHLKYPEADAAFSKQRGIVCSVMTADCLPVLLCDEDASIVAAAHAGWRGLCAGVIEQTVSAMKIAPARLYAYLGPAIGPHAFEVGVEVREAFIKIAVEAAQAFKPYSENKYLADLYLLARQRLSKLGVNRIYGDARRCTYQEKETFFSYRRDGKTGRMASLIWLD